MSAVGGVTFGPSLHQNDEVRRRPRGRDIGALVLR